MGCSFASLVFQPPPTKRRSSMASLILRTKDGNQISARYLNGNFKYTLLMSHGNAEDLPRVEEWVDRIFAPRIKANVMLYEYSGYGDSEVEPCESYVYSDCEAALWFLTGCLKIPLEHIIVYGRSLGSGPSCYLAEKYPNLSGLILQTPLTSVYRVMVDFRFTLPGDMFPNIDRMKHIQCPVLVIHGTRDEIVPTEHAEQLIAACPHGNKSIFLVEGAGHNNIESVAGPPLFQVIQNFIDSLDETNK